MTFVGTLYPFQEDAKDRMVDRGQMLLAMVMGAGKTPTTLSAIETLFDTNEIERVFVIVPSSLKYQWMREIKKFTTSRVVVIDGTPKERATLWRTSLNCHYTIINPELLTKDEAYFLKIVRSGIDCSKFLITKFNSGVI
jgi:SNF2 family DNA or RNA helicase